MNICDRLRLARVPADHGHKIMALLASMRDCAGDASLLNQERSERGFSGQSIGTSVEFAADAYRHLRCALAAVATRIDDPTVGGPGATAQLPGSRSS